MTMYPAILRGLLCIGALTTGAVAEWTHWGGDAASTKFAPYDQIHAGNVDSLKILWRYRLPDMEIISADTTNDLEYELNKGTPIVVDGVMYALSPYGFVVALDAATGEERWRFASHAWDKRGINSTIHRGVAHWRGSHGQQRILFGTSADTLYSLDAKTGLPDPAFGDGGRVDLTLGAHRTIDPVLHAMSSPPTIVGDVVVVGSALQDWHSGDSPTEFVSPGDVRAYDVRTGKQLWRFHTIPQPGEFGNDSWPERSWDHFGYANVWATISADAELGTIYLPVSAVSHQQYGGERPGPNLFSDALVCLDARSGKRLWHYQLIHHTLWNYDPPAAPVLLDVTVDGEPRKIVVQLTKQGFAFAFDRVTGEPIWPIEERAVPQSTVPGELSWPTQPFPTHPPPFDIQGLHENDLRDFSPQLRQSAIERVAPYGFAELFEPSSESGAILMPGVLGGADWVGGAADPFTGVLYVPSKSMPSVVFVAALHDSTAFSRYGGSYRTSLMGEEGLPLTKPPWGRITAIDMNTGEFLWVRPSGTGPVDHPALAGVEHEAELGWPTRVFLLKTPDLLLAVSESPHRAASGNYYWDREAYLRAYDPASGQMLAQIPMPDNAGGGLLSYEAGGRQFITVAAGGYEQPAELVTFAVPHAGEMLPPQAWSGYAAEHPAFDEAVAAYDAGEAAVLKRLLNQHPALATARGNLDDSYPLPELRGATLLHLAGGSVRVRLPDTVVELTNVLLQAGADPNALTENGASVLDLVVRSQQIGWLGLRHEMINQLLAAGAPPGPRLMWQALVGVINNTIFRNPPDSSHFDLAQSLHAGGVPVDLPFAAALGLLDEMSAFFAEDGSQLPSANTLYRPGPGSEASDQDVLNISLTYAAFGGHTTAVDFLLERGADINNRIVNVRQGRSANTSLHNAVIVNNPAMVRHLLARGADPMIRTERGSLPIRYARFGPREAVLQVLEEAMTTEP